MFSAVKAACSGARPDTKTCMFHFVTEPGMSGSEMKLSRSWSWHCTCLCYRHVWFSNEVQLVLALHFVALTGALDTIDDSDKP